MGKSVFVIISAFTSDKDTMNSSIPLPLHKVCGRSMLHNAIHLAKQITSTPPSILVDKNAEQIKEHVSNAQIVKVMDMSTADLIDLHALVHLAGNADMLILLPAHMPLVTSTTLQTLLQFTESRSLDAAVMSIEDPLSDISFLHQVCCFSTAWLNTMLENQKSQLSDIQAFHPADINELLIVNDRVNLAAAEARMRLRINEIHMRNGVSFLDPSQTYISPEVRIGRDTLIYPGNVLEGSTTIGDACILYPNNRLHNATIDDRVTLQSSVILDSTVGQDSTVGPFAYIRPDSIIGSNVRIGDFVEVKKSIIGDESKVSHLSYIGDAQLGKDVNIGCGVVCVNYDGKRKQRVTVGNHAFIGCNVNLVAPVEVDDNAYVAAGSTITENVPAKALAIARARQVNKEGWVDKREEKEQKEQEEQKEQTERK
ncbi:MAG TPA: bifunctional UDP-N-acetylglucosamine diphosphorylase/glucosamine-1-phosphate N-acetyltransferase GlmU [Clostridiales bacterium]|nr:bifunctional UDP-N-acetylglucosamine diphosphorylase/glucosamine-1-phosphate N-acetyltransferase GlmU [Clostridiales bacterium]